MIGAWLDLKPLLFAIILYFEVIMVKCADGLVWAFSVMEGLIGRPAAQGMRLGWLWAGFGRELSHNEQNDSMEQKLQSRRDVLGPAVACAPPAPNGSSLSETFISIFHIRQMLFIAQPFINIKQGSPSPKMVMPVPTQFYFVFPNSLPLGGYPWMLPQTLMHQNQGPSEKLESNAECKKSVVSNIILSPLPADGHCSTDSDSRAPNFKNYLPVKKIEDEEYRPLCSSHKKSKKSKQMENRNVVPNIIRLILSYIQKKEKSQRMVEALLKRYNPQTPSSIAVKRYYLFQKLVRSKMNNYVNEDTLKQLYCLRPDDYEVYPEHEQRIYNRLTRTLIADFLRDDILTSILTSKRMESAKKRNHLHALRTIQAKLHSLLQC